MSYIPHTPRQQTEMVKTCGCTSLDDLFRDIPAALRARPLDIPPGKSELEILRSFEKLAAMNYTHLTCFVGGGFYDHFIPAAVDALAGRSEFYTAYTPYQPELSQGTLQAMYEYQTDICELLEMDVANASLYDGGTALFEACQMAISRTGRRKVIIDGGVNPIYRKMIYSYSSNLSIDFKESDVSPGHTNREGIFNEIDDATAAVITQNPSFFGVVDDHSDIVARTHDKGALAVQSVNPVAAAVVKTPGAMGFDIATGEGQSLGIQLSFGGPYLGFMAAKRSLIRTMPGRVVGQTVDRDNRRGFVLTLQAREQHIRREKATSNICTNQALCALRAHCFLSLLGRRGIRELAMLCHSKAEYAKQRIRAIPGIDVPESNPTFHEFVVVLPMDAGEVVGRMIEQGIAPGFPLGRYYPDMKNCLLVAVTEKRTKHEIGLFAETLESVLCR